MRLIATRLFPGHSPLWRVFWLYGVIPSNVLWAITLLMLAGGAPGGALAVAYAVLLVYTGWIIAAVWASADNVRNARWGDMARLLTAAWALNTVLVVFFLALGPQ